MPRRAAARARGSRRGIAAAYPGSPTGMSDTDSTDQPGTAAEEAGIVDQQAVALEAIDDDEANEEANPSPS